MLQLIIILLVLSVTQALANPLKGYVSNQPLVKQHAKHDNRGHAITGKVEYSHIKGLIGILYVPETGEIDYVYPESDLHRLGVEAGDYILEINHEHCLPCLMPLISFYPANSYLDITIKTRFGGIRHLSVKLIPDSNVVGNTN